MCLLGRLELSATFEVVCLHMFMAHHGEGNANLNEEIEVIVPASVSEVSPAGFNSGEYAGRFYGDSAMCESLIEDRYRVLSCVDSSIVTHQNVSRDQRSISNCLNNEISDM